MCVCIGGSCPYSRNRALEWERFTLHSPLSSFRSLSLSLSLPPHHHHPSLNAIKGLFVCPSPCGVEEKSFNRNKSYPSGCGATQNVCKRHASRGPWWRIHAILQELLEREGRERERIERVAQLAVWPICKQQTVSLITLDKSSGFCTRTNEDICRYATWAC